ncbi:major capsid protein [Vibrio phage PVA8]|nr:major capsid protein [Vibrio phage PC-Liy1]URQ03237.1 major capsid protein [Vibrio phage PVA8]WBM58972.1 hypothetical protein vBValMPVA8_250 [Vibrio phage vB_ValM_PVA8]
MYYIVYKTTNTINNKIYIGVHKTDNLDDSYLGSGKHILNAIQKYGSENFTREIIDIFNSYEDAFTLESELVTEDFVSRPDTYNQALGGDLGNTNGWLKWNSSPARKNAADEHSKRMTGAGNPMYGKKRPEHSELMKERNPFKGKTHNKESLHKMSQSRKGKATGVNNAMFNGYVCTPLGKFESRMSAAEAHSISRDTVSRRIKNDKFPDWYIEN